MGKMGELFDTWEGAFARIENNPAVNLITGHFDSNRYWLLSEADGHTIIARGQSLNLLEHHYRGYYEAQEGD